MVVSASSLWIVEIFESVVRKSWKKSERGFLVYFIEFRYRDEES